MPENTAEQAAQDDFAAVLAEVSADVPDAAEPDAPADDTGTPEPDAPDAPAEASAPEPDALTEAEAAAAKLIEAGDLDGALKRLGLDPALVKIDRRQFFAMRKGLADAKAKEAAGAKARTEGAQLKSEAEKLYGPIAAGFQAMSKRDGARVRAAVELMAEASWEEIKAVVESANQPLDPGTAEVMRLRAELAERDRKARDEAAKGQAARAEQAQLAKLESQVAKTPLAKVPGAARRIYDLVRASYDGVGYAMSAQDAYRQVKGEAEAVAKALGAPPAPAARGRVLTERRAATPEGRKLSREEREADEFRRVTAEADAAAKSFERGVRRRSR